MNILLWALQSLLAIHTVIGAIWKFSHSAEQTMPSLKAIPNGVWQGMGILEILLGICLILPAIYKPAAPVIPIAALFIIVEMLIFSGLHLTSSETGYAPIIYWLAVVAVCSFIAYGRLKLGPL